MKLLYTPKGWTLMRIEGRKHHEVVTHISLDDGKTTLCKRATVGMVFDDAPMLLPTGQTYDSYAGSVIIHQLCANCLSKAQGKSK